MAEDFASVFAALKPAFSPVAKHFVVNGDYSLFTKKPSPFPQHKGKPLNFGALRIGKAYVSLHLMPIYMDPKLSVQISPALKKRMQGKACFNFKSVPEPEILRDLKTLVEASYQLWSERGWV
jgi:hypothetical protein